LKTYLWRTKRMIGETSTNRKEVLVAEEQDIREAFGVRGAETHKGSYGTVLIFGGSAGMEGSVGLAAMGALRSGAGRVIVAVPKSAEIRYGIQPEIMVRKIDDGGEGIFNKYSISQGKDLLEGADSVVIGPGFGRNRDSELFFEEIINEFEGPVLIDADGLYHLKYLLNDFRWKMATAAGKRIITPHAGEAAFLLDTKSEDVNDYKLETLSQLVELCGTTVLLKGHNTLVSKDGETVYFNETGNPGMATAGSGDVLSGIIGGILARKDLQIDVETAGAFGAWIHGTAGDFAAEELGQTGMIASDIIKYIPKAWKSVLKF